MDESKEREALLAEWAEAAGVHFVNRSYGRYTNATVSEDSLRQLIVSAHAARAQPEPEPELPVLTDERIIEIRDEHLPSQGEPFDCIAFARAVILDDRKRREG